MGGLEITCIFIACFVFMGLMIKVCDGFTIDRPGEIEIEEA